MDIREAKRLLTEALEVYRVKPYAELAKLVAHTVVEEQVGADGRQYQLEIQIVWDSQPQGNIRVIGALDDGGWRAFFPLIETFIKAPSGDFVDE